MIFEATTTKVYAPWWARTRPWRARTVVVYGSGGTKSISSGNDTFNNMLRYCRLASLIREFRHQVLGWRLSQGNLSIIIVINVIFELILSVPSRAKNTASKVIFLPTKERALLSSTTYLPFNVPSYLRWKLPTMSLKPFNILECRASIVATIRAEGGAANSSGYFSYTLTNRL